MNLWKPIENFTIKLIYILMTVFIIWLIKYLWSQLNTYRLIAKLEGPSMLHFVKKFMFTSDVEEVFLIRITKLIKNYQSPVKLWAILQYATAVTKPEHIQIILNHKHSLEKSFAYKLANLENSLLTAPVNKWKEHRNLLSHLFNTISLKSYISIFNKKNNILMDLLEKEVKKGNFDVYEYMSLYNLDTVFVILFGENVNYLNNSQCELVKYVGKYSEIIYLRVTNIFYQTDFLFNLTKHGKEMKKCKDYIINHIEEMIYKRKQSLYISKNNNDELTENKDSVTDDKMNNKPKIFLDLLLELTEKEKAYTRQEMYNEIIAFISGGVDTSSLVITFALTMLGMYPEIQEKLYTEVNKILDSPRPNITYDELSQLHYTEMVIKETMRILPVASILMRSITNDIKLDENITLPANSECLIGVLAVHRNPMIWPDPLRFDPERFQPEQIKLRHPYSFIPFSSGPRNCIGYKFAMLSMKTTLATIVKNYKITSPFQTLAEVEKSLKSPVDNLSGILISLEKRNQANQ